MKIVIAGDGKVGYALSEQLSKEGHDIVVIDSNPQVLQEALDNLDVMVVNGNAASLEVQKKAGVETSDLVIAATSSDEINLLCCVLARKLGCKHTISRVRNPEYIEQVQFLREEFGLSMTINPELAAAREIFRLIQFPSFLKRDSFAKGRVELVELKIGEESALKNKQLDQIHEVFKIRALICAVERDEKVYIPNGNFVLRAGDKITVTAPRSDLAIMLKNLKETNYKIHSVMIIGGGRIAEYLSEDLIRSGVTVKIVEKDEARCIELAEKLPGAIIINGDGSKQELLIEEGIKSTDAVITLTDFDEENLIISMFADYIGAPKTITKINRTEYSHLFKDRGIGSVVSPKQLTAHEIIRYVRAMGNTSGGAVRTLHRIVDEKAEALEFEAVGTTRNLGIPLMKLKLKEDILIACINRRGKVIIPKGVDTIEEKDIVIVVTNAERTIYDLNDIFADEAKEA